MVAIDLEIYLIHIFDKSEFENVSREIFTKMIKAPGLIK
jgi:hypothetical protein